MAESSEPLPTDSKTSKPRRHSKPRRSSRSILRAKSELELLGEISDKLDRVVAVLAAQGKDRNTQVGILAAADCESSFVATVVGLSPGAVRKLPAWRSVQGETSSEAAVTE